MPALKPALVVMVKEPRAGRVKTRLGAEIGMTAAAWWYRHQVATLLRKVNDPRWRVILAIAPDQALRSSAWSTTIRRVPQGRGDLGARMRRGLRAAGASPVCLIGSDIPGVSPAHIARAFAVLKGKDAVFGPSPDGGFWLVGVSNGRAVPARLFKHVPFSTEHAMADSARSIAGLRIGYADTLNDVDTQADLRDSA